MMRVSLREIRMVFERLVQVARVPDGLVASVRDCGLYSAALNLGGFELLESNLRQVEKADLSRINATSAATLDAGGLHAWLVAELAVDLAVAQARSGNGNGVRVDNLLQADELGVVQGFAVRHGFATAIDVRGPQATISLRPASATDVALLDRIRRDGLPVANDLWWHLYHASSAALAPDSISSRRHAGPVIVTDDGKLIGRQDDDETDFSMLTSIATARESNPVS